MTKLSNKEIANIVLILTGDIEPTGDSSIDDRRYNNLLDLQEVIDFLMAKMEDVMVNNRDEKAYSLWRASDTVAKYFIETQDYIHNVFEDIK